MRKGGHRDKKHRHFWRSSQSLALSNHEITHNNHSKKDERTLASQRAMISSVKWGSCLRMESLFQRPCTSICDISIVARAGFSHPMELIMSTMACENSKAHKRKE